MDPRSGDVNPFSPVLRFLAILSAARDFGVATSDIEHVALRFDPRELDPWELAGVLADLVPDRRTPA